MSWFKAKKTSDTSDSKSAMPKREEKPPGHEQEEVDKEYPDLKVVLPIVGAVCLSIFLASLDRTIIGVAIPAISNDFGSFGDISWYESAFLLTFAALQLPSGALFSYFPAKWTFIIIVLVFEIGSVICAAAPTSTAFIIGRAIAGIGCAGSSTGGQVIFANILPLEKRPKYQGFLGGTFGIASIAGPLLGGVFTTKVSWRWCFYINLPFGGLAVIMLLLFLPNDPAPKARSQESFWKKVEQFDPLGLLLLIPGLILLLLALQWGGNQYAWSSARVIATLVLGIVLLIAFGVWQIWNGEQALVPPRIMRQRTIASASAASFGFGAALIVVSFYLPIWYQAIEQLSAIAAGVRMLAYFLGTVIFVIASGFIVSKTGYYTPWLIGGTALMIVGCGLFSTLEVDSSTGHVIGYQIVFGAGMGMALVQTNVAAQAVLAPADLPIGVTLIQFANFIGGTIFVTVCQTILSSTLKTELSGRIPGLDVHAISGSGATSVAKTIPKELMPVFLGAYNQGIVNIFYCALAVSAFAFVSSWFVEWRSVKKQPTRETV